MNKKKFSSLLNLFLKRVSKLDANYVSKPIKIFSFPSTKTENRCFLFSFSKNSRSSNKFQIFIDTQLLKQRNFLEKQTKVFSFLKYKDFDFPGTVTENAKGKNEEDRMEMKEKLRENIRGKEREWG